MEAWSGKWAQVSSINDLHCFLYSIWSVHMGITYCTHTHKPLAVFNSALYSNTYSSSRCYCLQSGLASLIYYSSAQDAYETEYSTVMQIYIHHFWTHAVVMVNCSM